MHLGRFLHFSQKVVGVTLEPVFMVLFDQVLTSVQIAFLSSNLG